MIGAARAIAMVLAVAGASASGQMNTQSTLHQQEFLKALQEGSLLGPDGASELLNQMKKELPAEDWADDRDRLVVELARVGRTVVSRYVEGDEVPQQAADYKRCAAVLEAADQLEPDKGIEARMWFCRARAILYGGTRQDYEAAVQALQKAILLDPETGYHYNALGVAYLQMDMNKEAVEQFRKAIEREPAWSYPRHHLALVYMESGDFEAAEKEYQDAIRAAWSSNHRFGYLYYNLGLLAHELGHRKDAEQQYREALELFETEAKTSREQAARLSAQSKADAQAALTRARILDHDAAEAWNALGALWASERKRKKAEDAYNHALSLNPDLAAARSNLELLHSPRRERGQKINFT